MTDALHPTSVPFETALIETGGCNRIHVELSGNPSGRPALYLHGGPGSGLGSGRYRQTFNPHRYLVVGIDQRGCGRSTPLAAEALHDLSANDTDALIADIEAVRSALGIDRFVVAGSSWGATLALAYAETLPERVAALALVAVTTTSRAEVDWITEGVHTFLPEAWQRFERASGRAAGERVVEAYARRLRQGERAERLAAAAGWLAWEDALIAIDPNGSPIGQRFDEAAGLNFATLVTHYWAHDGFRPGPRALIENVAGIAHIPAVLIHGRLDIGGPVVTPWRLHQRWPASRLVVIEEEGHGGPRSTLALRQALDGFAG